MFGNCVCIQKAEIIEKPVEEPKGLKIGKGKLPDEDDSRDGAILKPVIIEPEVIEIHLWHIQLNFTAKKQVYVT